MALKNHIRGWTQEVVEPLRYLRRRLKSPFEALPQDEAQMELRNMLKQVELLAERKLLIEIERWISVNSQVTSARDQGKNIERYASELNVPEDLVALISL